MKNQKHIVPETFIAGPIKSKCVVEENGRIRTFVVTTEPITTGNAAQAARFLSRLFNQWKALWENLYFMLLPVL